MDQAGFVERRIAKILHHAVEVANDARAALHGQAVGFVQGDQKIVDVKNHRFEFLEDGRIERFFVRRRGWAFRQRGDSHGLAGQEAGCGIGAFAVHANLPGAAEFLDCALRDRGKMAAEPAVEADFGFVFGNGLGFYGQFRFLLYKSPEVYNRGICFRSSRVKILLDKRNI